MSSYDRIYAVVRKIPRGRVATYGQVAIAAGLRGHARQVGYALNAATHSVPWHRVINAKGEISRRSAPGSEKVQRALLEREGVEFDDSGRVALHKFRWKRRVLSATPIASQREVDRTRLSRRNS